MMVPDDRLRRCRRRSGALIWVGRVAGHPQAAGRRVPASAHAVISLPHESMPFPGIAIECVQDGGWRRDQPALSTIRLGQMARWRFRIKRRAISDRSCSLRRWLRSVRDFEGDEAEPGRGDDRRGAVRG
jgi:hypothetical protein